jgi:hypothetical protein
MCESPIIAKTKVEGSTVVLKYNQVIDLYVAYVLDENGRRTAQALSKTLKDACRSYGALMYGELFGKVS